MFYILFVNDIIDKTFWGIIIIDSFKLVLFINTKNITMAAYIHGNGNEIDQMEVEEPEFFTCRI